MAAPNSTSGSAIERHTRASSRTVRSRVGRESRRGWKVASASSLAAARLRRPGPQNGRLHGHGNALASAFGRMPGNLRNSGRQTLRVPQSDSKPQAGRRAPCTRPRTTGVGEPHRRSEDPVRSAPAGRVRPVLAAELRCSALRSASRRGSLQQELAGRTCMTDRAGDEPGDHQHQSLLDSSSLATPQEAAVDRANCRANATPFGSGLRSRTTAGALD